MIGVILSKRREEFYNFIVKHPMDVTEIFDVTNTSSLEQFETIYSDGPVDLTGPFSVVDISKGEFQDIFQNLQAINQNNDLEPVCIQRTFAKYQQSLLSDIPDISISDIVEQVSAPAPKEHDEVQPILIEDAGIMQAESAKETIELGDNDLDNLFSRPEPKSAPEPLFSRAPEPEHEPAEEKQQITFRSALEPATRRAPTTNLFSSKPQVVKRTGALHVCASKGQKKFNVPIFTFCSLTDKAGVSTLTASLAATLSLQNPETRVLYLDLDMSNPNYLQALCGINPSTDASVKTIVSLSENDFIDNISLLTETVDVSQGIFSVITWGKTTFTEKRMLASQDFNYFLNTVYNSFDIVLVDLGKLQSTLDYQMTLLQSPSSKHFMIADGSSQRTISTFVQEAQQLPYNFEIIINKNLPRSGSFIITRQLRQEPVASISLHNNIDRILTNQYPLSVTALYTELCALGGRL